MRKEKIVTGFIIAIAMMFSGCQKDEIRHENETDNTEFIEEEKQPEIATESRFVYDPDYGEPPKEVQRIVDEFQRVEIIESVLDDVEEESTGCIDVNGYGWIELQYFSTYHIMDSHLTRSNGSINVFGHHETWYSIHEPGQTVTAWEIPGKHVADDGTIRDEDGYICVASSDHRRHTIIMTSVGPGKVYDCGCSSGTVDVYTNW